MNQGYNSAKPNSGAVVSGVYNSTHDALADGQAAPLPLTSDGSAIVVSSTSSGTQQVDIEKILGNPVALSNPLPVELSDGTNPFGTSGNPLFATINLTKILGAAPSLTNPLYAELTDGTNAFGTSINPIFTKGLSDGSTGSAVPSTAKFDGARAATAYPTAVSDGQLVGVMADKAGRQVVVQNAPRDLIGTAIVSNNSTASGVSFIGAIGSTYTDIITLVFTNRSSTATVVSLTDGTATYTFAIAANGGIVMNFPTPLPATSLATAWTIGNSATVACDYMAIYAKNK